MRPITPAASNAEDPELVARIAGAAGAESLTGDPLREALIHHAVRTLRERIADDNGLVAIRASAEAHDDADGWLGAGQEATRLGLADPVERSLLFLLAERAASGARQSAWAQALAHAAGRRFEHEQDVDARGQRILDGHGATFGRFVDAQYELTQALLRGCDAPTLHRAIRLHSQDTPPAEGEGTIHLWPLSSWSATPAFAVTLCENGYNSRGRGGPLVLFSATVPSERIISTAATGWGVALENEAVVAVGARDDRATVSYPAG